MGEVWVLFFSKKIKPWFYFFDCEIVASSLKNMRKAHEVKKNQLYFF